MCSSWLKWEWGNDITVWGIPKENVHFWDFILLRKVILIAYLSFQLLLKCSKVGDESVRVMQDQFGSMPL